MSTAQKAWAYTGSYRLVRFCISTMSLDKESHCDEATEMDFNSDILVGLTFGSKEEAVLIVEK